MYMLYICIYVCVLYVSETDASPLFLFPPFQHHNKKISNLDHSSIISISMLLPTEAAAAVEEEASIIEEVQVKPLKEERP